jgi:hypothetical protein
MTLTEFFDELGKIRSSFDWKLVPDTHVRPDRRSKHRLQIRATSKRCSRPLMEPISVLCYARSGKLSSWPEAGRALQLSAADTWYIMAASNDLTWHEIDGTREPHPKIQDVRNKLAVALGLELEVDSAVTMRV